MMSRSCSAFAGSLIALSLAGRAGAATIGSLDQAYGRTIGHTLVGQSFTAPADVADITGLAFSLHNDTGHDVTITLSLSPFNGSSSPVTIGAALASRTITLAPGTYQPISIGIDVPVTPNKTYLAATTFGSDIGQLGGGYFAQSDYYAGGNGVLGSPASPVSYPNLDLAFRVDYSVVPEPAIAMLAAAPIVLLRQRRRD